MSATYAILNGDYTLDQLLDGLKRPADKLMLVRRKLGLPNTDARQRLLYGMQEVIIGVGLPVYAITGNGLRQKRSIEEAQQSFEGYVHIDGVTQENFRRNAVALLTSSCVSRRPAGATKTSHMSRVE